MASKTSKFTDSELAEELLRRLDAKMAATGNRNYAIARLKVNDAATYIRRGEQEGRVIVDKGQERAE